MSKHPSDNAPSELMELSMTSSDGARWDMSKLGLIMFHYVFIHFCDVVTLIVEFPVIS